MMDGWILMFLGPTFARLISVAISDFLGQTHGVICLIVEKPALFLLNPGRENN